MLDSGAFSAWTKRINIDLDEYISFCLQHLPYINYIINLDVIPGKFGQKALPAEEIEKSASKGWANYEYMIKQGIPKEKLIHIFHQGENFKWLEKIVEAMPYIGLSPANDRSTSEKTQWLDDCMKYVCDDKGYPKVKWHGFAVTSLRLMFRYPWYSVDSTSWVMTSRMGGVMVPRYKSGKWVYDEQSWKVSVSARSPDKSEAGKHIDTFPEQQKQHILDYFSEKGYVLGKSEFELVSKNHKLKSNEKWNGPAIGNKREIEIIIEPGLCNDYKLRDEMNIIYYLDLEKTMQKWPWAFQAKGVKGFNL
jgi:hypothetical protein